MLGHAIDIFNSAFSPTKTFHTGCGQCQLFYLKYNTIYIIVKRDDEIEIENKNRYGTLYMRYV